MNVSSSTASVSRVENKELAKKKPRQDNTTQHNTTQDNNSIYHLLLQKLTAIHREENFGSQSPQHAVSTTVLYCTVPYCIVLYYLSFSSQYKLITKK
jgi:hypothetical protein